MDIGSGTVSNVKVNDTIIPSLGMTSLYRFNSTALEAIRITPAVSFETNKEFNKRNIIYDQDFQFFVGFLDSSRLVRAWQKYKELQGKPGNERLKFSNDFANWGAGLKLFLGSELGGVARFANRKSIQELSDRNGAHLYRRPYSPKTSGYVEYKRINLTLSVLPRYLFATEYSTRQSSDGTTIRLAPLWDFALTEKRV